MSRAEVAAELRETEGDPIVRRRRRQLRLNAMARNWETLLRPGDLVILGNGRLSVAIRCEEKGYWSVLAKTASVAYDTLERAAKRRGASVLRHDSLARRVVEECEVGGALPPDLAQQSAALQPVSVQRRMPLARSVSHRSTA
jgi:flagellar biosynthesis protein FlhB